MIQVLILLYLSGSIAEQTYISELACDVSQADYVIAFGHETKFSRLYIDGSTIDSGEYTSLEVVRNAEGKIVHSINTGE